MHPFTHPACRTSEDQGPPLATAVALLGSQVQWDKLDPYTGAVLSSYSGLLRDVVGRNVKIDQDWHWLPDLRNLRTLASNSPIAPEQPR